MMKSESKLPETFASVRFVGEHLQPTEISNFLHLKPTVSYAKGDTYSVGSRKIEQKRQFGLWLLRTENLVFSSSWRKHINYLMLNILNFEEIYEDLSPLSWEIRPKHLPNLLELRDFIQRHNYEMIFSIYWFGPPGTEQPVVDKEYEEWMSMLGAKLETDFETASNDDLQLAP